MDIPVCQKCGKQHVTRYGTQACKAHKRDRSPCTKSPENDTAVCHMHGSKSLKGANHPNWKGGISSGCKPGARMPPRLREMFDGAMADPELIDVRSGIAYVHVRISELEARLHTGESGSLWKALTESWAEVNAAARSGDSGALQAAMSAHGRIISAGGKDEAAWKELIDLQHDRAALSQAELRIIEKRVGVVTPAEFLTTIDLIYGAVARHVTDRKALNEIGMELQKLLLGQAGEKRAAVAEMIEGRVAPAAGLGGGGPTIDIEPAPAAEPAAEPPPTNENPAGGREPGDSPPPAG